MNELQSTHSPHQLHIAMAGRSDSSNTGDSGCCDGADMQVNDEIECEGFEEWRAFTQEEKRSIKHYYDNWAAQYEADVIGRYGYTAPRLLIDHLVKHLLQMPQLNQLVQYQHQQQRVNCQWDDATWD
jgi:hypothetical protein